MYKGKYRDDIDITDIHDFNPSGNWVGAGYNINVTWLFISIG